MNPKYFIFSFILLVFFSLIYVEACPDCNFVKVGPCNDCGGQITDAVFLPNTLLNVTVSVPNGSFPEGIGHFTFSDDKGFSDRILKDPVFINGRTCENSGPNEVNPLETQWGYNIHQSPPSGDTVNIWLTLYWDCRIDDVCGLWCTAQELNYQVHVP